MKWIKWTVGVLVAVIVLVLALDFALGPMVKAGAEKMGPKLMGVSIKLGQARISILRGKVLLKELVVGNPEGFTGPHAFRLKSLVINVDVLSTLSKKVIVNKIEVERPEIVYEIGLHGSNIGKILDHLKGGKPKAGPPSHAAPTPAEPSGKPTGESKKVVIQDLLIRSAQFNVTAPGMEGEGIPMPLPDIHLTQVGESSGGVSLKEALTTIFKEIVATVTQAASGAGAMVGQGVNAIGADVQKADRQAAKEVSKSVESVEGLFRKSTK